MEEKVKHNNRILRQYFDKILDLVGDGMFISDRQGNTVRVNRTYERLTGWEQSMLANKNVESLKSEGLFDTILNPKIVSTGKPATKIQTNREGKRLVLTGHPVFNEEGQVALVVTFVRDTSLITKLREQIFNQSRLLERYRKNALSLDEEGDPHQPLIAKCPALSKLISSIENLSRTDATVLLQGETGVGKDVIARHIHRCSSRFNKPFFKVDCPSISESLFESELFGYEPGAFSGARATGKPGLLEMADKGTLFLDEIGELPLQLQPKLLRVLQDREIVRVGSTKTRKVDVRIVSATNLDLEQQVRRGRFRKDLYYRLRVASITIPPLRERREDIEHLAEHFLCNCNDKYNKTVRFSPATLHCFRAYDWPGNVREMENLVQILAITDRTGCIEVSALPSNMVVHRNDNRKDSSDKHAKEQCSVENVLDLPDLVTEIESGTRSLSSIIKEIERKILKYSLSKYDSHTSLAKRFKVDRSTIFRKLSSGCN